MIEELAKDTSERFVDLINKSRNVNDLFSICTDIEDFKCVLVSNNISLEYHKIVIKKFNEKRAEFSRKVEE